MGNQLNANKLAAVGGGPSEKASLGQVFFQVSKLSAEEIFERACSKKGLFFETESGDKFAFFINRNVRSPKLEEIGGSQISKVEELASTIFYVSEDGRHYPAAYVDLRLDHRLGSQHPIAVSKRALYCLDGERTPALRAMVKLRFLIQRDGASAFNGYYFNYDSEGELKFSKDEGEDEVADENHVALPTGVWVNPKMEKNFSGLPFFALSVLEGHIMSEGPSKLILLVPNEANLGAYVRHYESRVASPSTIRYSEESRLLEVALSSFTPRVSPIDRVQHTLNQFLLEPRAD